MEQNNQQPLQSQPQATNKFIRDEKLDNFLESLEFLNDPFIKSLVDKSIHLGFSLEVIKETFARFLLNASNTNTGTDIVDLSNLNYSKLIDEEKFIEKLILISIQFENSSNNFKNLNMSNNSGDLDDYDDDDDDLIPLGTVSTTVPGMNTADQASNNVGISNLIVNNLNKEDFEYDGSDFNEFYSYQHHSAGPIQQPHQNQHHNLIEFSAANQQIKLVHQNQEITKLQQLQHHQQQRIIHNKKAQQKLQQQEQEYLTQSINRINDKSNLRPIIVDGNDVATSSSNKQLFLISRIKKVVDYFESRNHLIYVILPQWRKEQIMAPTNNPVNTNSGLPSGSGVNNPNNTNTTVQAQSSQLQNIQLNSDQLTLLELEQKNQVHYTPSKRVGAKRIVCDDDSYLLKLAVVKNGVIVSNDNFKRFLNSNEEIKLVIEERVLMYSFIDDEFMPAEDPLGKNGPSLENFLRFESFTNQQYMKRCPYRKKCTYGSKCKFWHPERGTHQGSQLFKTAFQSVQDNAQETKMKLEIILNKNQQESSSSIITLEAKKLSQSPSSSVDRDMINKQQIELNQDFLDLDDDLSDIDSSNLKTKYKNKAQIKQSQNYTGNIIIDYNNFEANNYNRAISPINNIKTKSNSTLIQKKYQQSIHFNNEMRAMGPTTTVQQPIPTVISPLQQSSSVSGSSSSSLKSFDQNQTSNSTSKSTMLDSSSPSLLNRTNSSLFNNKNFNNQVIDNINNNNNMSPTYQPNSIWDSIKQNKNKNDLTNIQFENTNLRNLIDNNKSYIDFESLLPQQTASNNNTATITAATLAYKKSATGQSQSQQHLQPQVQTQTKFQQQQLNKLNHKKLNQNHLKNQLCNYLAHEQADLVLLQNPDETDIEKLIFLARGLSLNNYLQSYDQIPNMSNQNQIQNNNTSNNNSNNNNKKQNRNESDLKAQLANDLSSEQISKVLAQYPEETNIEKLIFLARNISINDIDF